MGRIFLSIISNPTIDYILLPNGEKIVRPGGPPTFSILYKEKLGFNPTLIGKIASSDISFFYKIYGEKLNDLIISLCSQKFYLLYKKTGERIAIPYNKCSLPDRHSVIEKISQNNFDAIIWNPTIISTLRDIELIETLSTEYKVYVDVQGIARSPQYVYHFFKLLHKKKIDFLHGSLDEVTLICEKIGLKDLSQCFRVLSAKEKLLTNGPHEAIIYCENKKSKIFPPENINALENTGAGDVLLLSYVTYRQEHDCLTSAKLSINMATEHVKQLAKYGFSKILQQVKV